MADSIAVCQIRFASFAVQPTHSSADKLASVVTRLREMSPLYELAKEGVDLSTTEWRVDQN